MKSFYKIRFFLTVMLVFAYSILFSQTGCAIVYHYDETGFLIFREYYCGDLSNVGGRPAVGGEINNHEKLEVQPVNVLYPNPTTGKFSIRFGEELKAADIYIVDITGKVLARQTGSGFNFQFDVSGYAAGTYFIRIINKGKTVTQKVIKQ